jgi:hypothetical protein
VTARVFVPLVGANGEGAQVFEAIAGETAPEIHPARLLPQISELFDFGLYGIGQTVREAVTRFIDARRSKVWLGRRNARVHPWNLRISELQVGRLSDENARSAGLGLAIAALLHAFGRDPGIVFATGEIKLPHGPGDPDVGIAPVEGVRGKLTLVGDYIVQHRGSLVGTRIVVAAPSTAPDGRPLAAAESAILNRLKADAADAGATLEFVFADSLDAIEESLGPFAIRERITPVRAAALTLAVVAAAAAAFIWVSLADAPIDLAFAEVAPSAASRQVATADGASPEPRRARYDSVADKLQLLGPCYDAQRQPLVVGGETLLMRVVAHDSLPFASRVRPPRLFIASVSRAADPVILDAAQFHPVKTADAPDALLDLTTAIPIEAVEDEVRLFVVATRDPAIEISALQDDLRKHLVGLSGAAVLTTTASFLRDRLGAELEYQFKVTNDRAACPA